MDLCTLSLRIMQARSAFKDKNPAPLPPEGTGLEQSAFVSPATYEQLAELMIQGSRIDGKEWPQGVAEMKMHVLGFRVHRDETLGPEDCRIVIRTKT